MAVEAQKVIATSGVLVLATGTINSVARNEKLPSTRFLIGVGVAYLLLSAMSEAEPELAKAFSIAILTTVVLGEGGGVLSYINRGEMDTHKKPSKGTADPLGGGGRFTPSGNLELATDESVQQPGFPDSFKSITPLRSDMVAPFPDLATR